ncbi:MAG: hypothetical protein JNL74_12175 [Fibrobacteres bacterium]|nr:hypothetical protein [Fibrobacterota bacterium]
MKLAQIDTNKSIEWLIENGSMPVKYVTYKNILKKDEKSQFMRNLWLEVNKSKEVQNIFSKQKADGSWCIGGSTRGYGYDPSEPKYVTTAWILPLLAEMGFTVKDTRIKKACDYILNSWLFKTPFFDKQSSKIDFTDKLGFSQCRFNWYLMALSSVGCANHKLVQKGFSVPLNRQRDDGGWVMPGHIEERNGRSCPWSSYGSMMAMYYAKNKSYRKPLENALGYLVGHLASKDEKKIQTLYFRGHNIVRELKVLSELNIGLDSKPIKAILNWLIAMYDKNEGTFIYSGKPASKWYSKSDGASPIVAKYNFKQIAEKDWFTYHMTTIVVNMRKH